MGCGCPNSTLAIVPNISQFDWVLSKNRGSNSSPSVLWWSEDRFYGQKKAEKSVNRTKKWNGHFKFNFLVQGYALWHNGLNLQLTHLHALSESWLNIWSLHFQSSFLLMHPRGQPVLGSLLFHLRDPEAVPGIWLQVSPVLWLWALGEWTTDGRNSCPHSLCRSLTFKYMTANF